MFWEIFIFFWCSFVIEPDISDLCEVILSTLDYWNESYNFTVLLIVLYDFLNDLTNIVRMLDHFEQVIFHEQGLEELWGITLDTSVSQWQLRNNFNRKIGDKSIDRWFTTLPQELNTIQSVKLKPLVLNVLHNWIHCKNLRFFAFRLMYDLIHGSFLYC
jgi:hypothetical protein